MILRTFPDNFNDKTTEYSYENVPSAVIKKSITGDCSVYVTFPIYSLV